MGVQQQPHLSALVRIGCLLPWIEFFGRQRLKKFGSDLELAAHRPEDAFSFRGDCGQFGNRRPPPGNNDLLARLGTSGFAAESIVNELVEGGAGWRMAPLAAALGDCGRVEAVEPLVRSVRSAIAKDEARAAACERSSTNFFTYGPRSLTRQRIVLPVARAVTSIQLPSGSVRWAAVKWRFRKISPVAVSVPSSEVE